jgi:lipoprotein-anchoring transpeptidase ErfK/SrfK
VCSSDLFYLGYVGIIGIHGTDQPQLLQRFPRAYSHGCTRLYNRDITWLYRRCPVGTRVWSVR